MKRKRMNILLVLSLLLVALPSVAYCVLPRLRQERPLRTRSDWNMRVGPLRALCAWIADEVGMASIEDDFVWPEGRVGDLEEWMADRRRKQGALGMGFSYGLRSAECCVRVSEDGSIRLVDTWGQRLRYEFPASDPKYIFFLYSI